MSIIIHNTHYDAGNIWQGWKEKVDDKCSSITSSWPSLRTSVMSINFRFAMVLPPPNVTGVLHLGHALTATVQDSLVRMICLLHHQMIWRFFSVQYYRSDEIKSHVITCCQISQMALNHHMQSSPPNQLFCWTAGAIPSNARLWNCLGPRLRSCRYSYSGVSSCLLNHIF